jgi:hypothetical protein
MVLSNHFQKFMILLVKYLDIFLSTVFLVKRKALVGVRL